MIQLIVSTILLASAAAANAPAAPAGASACVPLVDAMRIGDHVVFSRIFEAAEVPLNATDRYTVFVPEDGEVVSPGDSDGIAGLNGITGLFSAYGIDTRTPMTIRSSPVFDQVKAFVPYYVVRGAYTLAELRGRSSSNHLTTLFDTESPTCRDPDSAASLKESDGDLKIEQVSGMVGLTDDSTNTVVQATIVQGDIEACGGTIVHLIRGILNPCCNDRAADCTAAPLDAKQIDTSLEATDTSGAHGAAAAAVAAAAAALTAAAAVAVAVAGDLGQ